MADEENQRPQSVGSSRDNQSGQSSTPPNKSINVTKPQETRTPMSNIDASMVSDHTLREQQALERLKKKVGQASAKESSASKIKTIIAIILVIVLIIIMVVVDVNLQLNYQWLR